MHHKIITTHFLRYDLGAVETLVGVKRLEPLMERRKEAVRRRWRMVVWRSVVRVMRRWRWAPATANVALEEKKYVENSL